MNLMQEFTQKLISDAERRMDVAGTPRPRRERRCDWPRRDRFDAVMTGDDKAFRWKPGQPYSERYDGEQELAIFDAVRVAVALTAASPAARWKVIEHAIRAIAYDYSEQD